MSDISARLASLILVRTTSTAVADAVFPYAEAAYCGPLRKVVLSDTVAGRYLRGGAPQVALAVTGTRSAALLDKFARHPSLTVRRAVAAHPQVQASTVQYLWGHAVKKDDAELRNLALRRMTAAAALEAVGGLAENSVDFRGAILSVLRMRGTAADFAVAASSYHSEVRAAGLAALWSGNDAISGEAYLRMLDRHYPAQLGRCLAAALASIKTVTTDVVEQALAWRDRVDASMIRQEACHRASAMQPEAASMVVGGDPFGFWRTALRVSTDEAVLAPFITPDNRGALTALLVRVSTLPEATRQRLAAAIADCRDDSVIASSFSRLFSRDDYQYSNMERPDTADLNLTEGQVLAVLREGNYRTTGQWLAGDYHLPVTADLLRALLLEPGDAFSHGHGAQPDMLQRGRRIVAAVFEHHAGTELANVFVDTVGSSGLAVLLCEGKSRDWMYDQLHAAFGDNPKLWETAIQLADKWDGTFVDLINTTPLMLDLN